MSQKSAVQHECEMCREMFIKQNNRNEYASDLCPDCRRRAGRAVWYVLSGENLRDNENRDAWLKENLRVG